MGESLKFPKATYFDVENGGMKRTNASKQLVQTVDEEIETENQVAVTSDKLTANTLSTNPEEFEQEMVRIKASHDASTMQFENQLDYIRHLCVIRRCEKIYHRAIRHAQKGNVQECSQILAEVWEYVDGYEYPLIIADGNGKRFELKEEDLQNVMRLCHRNYAGYLIDCARHIGESVDRRHMNKNKLQDINRQLLSMVWKNLENARVYAEKYNVF